MSGRLPSIIDNDIRAVRRQVESGEIDEETADRMIQSYRDEMSERSPGSHPDDEAANSGRPGWSWRRSAGSLLLIGVLAATSITAYMAIRPRNSGFITGNQESAVDLSQVTNDQMEAVIAANADVPEIAAMRLALADRYFEAGRFSDALAHYLGALEGVLDSTRRARALARIGWMSHRSGASDIALSYLNEARLADPGYAETDLFLGLLLLDQGQADAAVERLAPLLETDLPEAAASLVHQALEEARAVSGASG